MPGYDAHKNFAYSTVATAPSPATSGTSLVVASGEGAGFPAVPFNAVICPIGSQPTAANAEVVRVTGRSTDTLTIARAQEGSSARTVIVGDQIFAAVTAKTLTDVEANAVVSIVSKASDETVNNSAVLQNDDDLLFAIPGNSTALFFVEAYLLINSPSVNSDFKASWSVPSGCTGFFGVLNSGSTNWPTWGAQTTGANPLAGSGLGTVISVGSVAGSWYLSLGAWVTDGGTAGNVVLQWAQNSATAENTIVKASSFLRVTRIKA